MAATVAEPQQQAAQAERDSEAEPARASEAPVERVTQRPPKDPKKVAAGRAGAAAKKAKKERLLEEFRTAKESLRPGEPPAAEGGESAAASPTKPRPVDDSAPQTTAALTPRGGSWTPWIVGACLAGGALMCLTARRHSPGRGFAGVDKQPRAAQKTTGSLPASTPCRPMVEVHLDSRDPFHME